MLKRMLPVAIVLVSLGSTAKGQDACEGPWLTMPELRELSDQEGQNELSRVRPCAEQGIAGAQTQLGRMYVIGFAVEEDRAEAARWYELAAVQGDAVAQYNLGQMYRLGFGVSQDEVEAARWYLLAAEQGFFGAQAILGFIYTHGIGVQQDFGEAARWYELAAEQGSAVSQFSLGMVLTNPEYSGRDLVQAYKWFSIAAVNGNPVASNGASAEFMMTVLDDRMTADEIAEAEGLAREWIGTYLR